MSARGTVEEPGKNVAQKSGLNRSISGEAWGRTVTMLTYKTARLGGTLVKEARELSARFRRSWAGFARTGDPGWPAFEGEGRPVQVLDAAPEVRPYPEEASRRLWEGYEFGELPLLK